MPGKVILTMTEGPTPGKVFEFREHEALVIGRSRNCQVRLSAEDKKVARHQWLLEVNPPKARLRDLGSLNGTFVNGKKYGGRSPGESPDAAVKRGIVQVDLSDGDEVRAGGTRFKVQIETPPPAACEPTEVLVGRMLDSVRVAGDLGLDDIPGYKLLNLIRKGGNGAVYRAQRKKDGTIAAIKVMLARVRVIDQARRKFLREIKVTERCDHPRCVKFLESGSFDDNFFFAMEYCEGGSVDGLMGRRGGRLAPAEAVPLAIQALEGLAFVHQLKEEDKKDTFVHRDLKPSNLLLTRLEGGSVKVTDYGLGKKFDEAGLTSLTLTGEFAGTFQFMPREQIIDFKRLTPAADVWSMGATLYNMLTGAFARDFPAGADPVAVVLNKPVVPIVERDPSISKRLAEVVGRALAEEIGDRYASADEFRRALEKILPLGSH